MPQDEIQIKTKMIPMPMTKKPFIYLSYKPCKAPGNSTGLRLYKNNTFKTSVIV